jgi:hypothetical protein
LTTLTQRNYRRLLRRCGSVEASYLLCKLRSSIGVNVVETNSNAEDDSCHGPAIFANILDDSGKPIVEGKKITGFTTQAEHEMGIMDGLRAWNEPMVDEHAKALGANCKSAILTLMTREYADSSHRRSIRRNLGRLPRCRWKADHRHEPPKCEEHCERRC